MPDELLRAASDRSVRRARRGQLGAHGSQRVPASALTEHLMALALHPDVGTALRLAAGALAIEHRRFPGR
jgi:hypothetical protein